MLLARIFHNLFVHPLMGIVDLLSLGYWYPDWLDQLHDSTADLAFGPANPEEELENALKALPDGYVAVATFWDGNDEDAMWVTHLQVPDNREDADETLDAALGLIMKSYREIYPDEPGESCEGCSCGC